MNRSSFPTSQLWRVVLALFALISLGAPSVCAEEKKSAQPKPENKLAGISAEIARIHDPNVRALMQVATKRHNGDFFPFVISPDGKMLLHSDATSDVTPVSELCVVRGVVKETAVPQGAGWPLAIGRSVFSPDGRFLVRCPLSSLYPKENGMNSQIVFYDTRTWKQLRIMEAGNASGDSMCFSQDGSRLIVTNCDASITIYEVATGRALSSWRCPSPTEFLTVAFMQTPNGERGVAVSHDYFNVLDDGQVVSSLDAHRAEPVQLWDVEKNHLLARIPTSNTPYLASFSPDRKRVVVGVSDFGAQFLRLADTRLLCVEGKNLKRRLLPHKAPFFVTSVSFTPDGKNILALSGEYGDDWLHVFDVALAQTSKP